MINYLTNLIWKRRFKKIQKSVANAGFEIADVDEEQGVLLIVLEENISTLLTISRDLSSRATLQLDCSIVFDSSFINLKFLSTITEIAFSLKCYIMGFVAKNAEQTKLYLAKDIPYTTDGKKIKRFITNLKICSKYIIKYFYDADARISTDFLDLSMFSDIDLNLFNPQLLGENKEFMFKNWDAYIKHVEENDDSSVTGTSETFIAQLKACKEFEEKNSLLLAEVGHRVFKELIWNTKFKNLIDEDDVYIN